MIANLWLPVNNDNVNYDDDENYENMFTEHLFELGLQHLTLYENNRKEENDVDDDDDDDDRRR